MKAELIVQLVEGSLAVTGSSLHHRFHSTPTIRKIQANISVLGLAAATIVEINVLGVITYPALYFLLFCVFILVY